MEIMFNLSEVLAQVAPAELQKERMSICKACDKYKPTLHLCGECGCQLDFKTRIAYTSCPIYKWEAVVDIPALTPINQPDNSKE